MIIKVIASFLVLGGCTYLGLLYGDKLKNRFREMDDFITALDMLKFNIKFLNLPLEEAMQNAVKSQSGVVADIFNDIAVELSSNNGNSTFEIWEMIMKRHRVDSFIKNEEIEVLCEFAQRLGGGDAEEQENNINITIAKLRHISDEVRGEAAKKTKLYRGLGVLSGMFIVIVLF